MYKSTLSIAPRSNWLSWAFLSRPDWKSTMCRSFLSDMIFKRGLVRSNNNNNLLKKLKEYKMHFRTWDRPLKMFSKFETCDNMIVMILKHYQRMGLFCKVECCSVWASHDMYVRVYVLYPIKWGNISSF